MQNRDVTERVLQYALPLAEEVGVTVWDVQFQKEGGSYVLTVFIDREEGVSLDHCEALSRKLDPVLDGREFSRMPAYTLCVSSAGLERRLRKPEHFAHCLGQKIEIRFYKAVDGVKSVTGLLRGYCDGAVTIETADGEKTFVPEEIALVSTVAEF